MRVMNEEKLNAMLAFIREYAHDNNGDIPALSKIMEKTGMVKSVAYRYMMTLRDRGLVEYSGKNTMRLSEDLSYYRKYGSVKVPIYGSVICGSPEEEEQQNPEYLALPEEWITGECFLLRARSNSMTGVGISDGDLVLVRREHGSPEEYSGKIIVALTEDGNTLKRLFWENGRPRLHPENGRYKDIYPEQLEMQGVAVKVIKEVK